MSSDSGFLVPVSEEQIRRERQKAREIRKSPWWKRRKAAGVCHYCGALVGAAELTMDHLVPVIRGGRSTRGNLVAACKPCNTEKKHSLDFEWEPKGEELRGIEAHMRQVAPVLLEEQDPMRAAVAMILAPHPDGPKVLMIRRAEHPEDPWSGHMAFPGGRSEPEDSSLVETAMRETLEEVGVDLARHGELIVAMNELPAYSSGRPVGMVVSPFLFSLDRTRETRIDPGEVAAALWLPLAAFRDEANHQKTRIDSANFKADVDAFVVEEQIIWGLTHRMITNFLTAVATDPDAP
jgi:8-oxo-dGTP pyrophosphatase MutT (NUDIX family)